MESEERFVPLKVCFLGAPGVGKVIRTIFNGLK